MSDRNEFEHYFHDPKNPNSLSNNTIRAIYEDSYGNLWIGTDNGLNKFNRKNNKFEHFTRDPNNPYSLSNNRVRVIFEDKKGNLWIGTYGGGLNLFDRKEKKFRTVIYGKSSKEFRQNYIVSIYEDRTGLLWIGTYGGGVIKLNRDVKFLHYFSKPDNPNSLSSNLVFSIYEDKEGILWIGTYGGGLNKFDRRKGRFTHYLNNPEDPESLSNNNVRCIIEDREGNLWIGTFNGLNRFDRKREKFKVYRHDPTNPHSLSHNYIRTLYEDHDGNLWIGTYGGLNLLNRKNNRFIHYKSNPEDPESLSNDRVFSIYEDGEGNLWIGTLGGLNKFDKKREKFKVYKHDPENPESLSNNFVLSIYEDSSETLWIGTYGGGLNKFDKEKEVFKHYTTLDGLPNNTVYGILEDSQGNLWLSTNNGLSKFNPKKETFRNYNVEDGLQENEFNSGAYFKNKKGEMFFGGVNGFNAFYPSEVIDNPYIPEIAIVGLKLLNEPVLPGRKFKDHIILKKSISETKEIILPYSVQLLTIEFSALHFASPKKNQYAYKMEGLDKEWNYVGNQNFATYTNLSPGEYIFKVKASNNDGVWNEEGISLKIKVLPPFWMTWWFRSLLICIIIGLIILGYWIKTKAIRRRAQLLEKEIEKRTLQLKQINTEIKRAYSILQMLIEQFPHGIAFMNSKGKIIFTNPRGKEYLNLLGKFDKEGNLTHFYNYSIRELKEELKKGKLRIELEKPSKKTFELTISEILLGSEKKGILIVIRDITEDLTREAIQRQQERLASIGELAAGIAHDFNNILTTILGNCEFIQFSTELPGEVKKRVKTIMEQGERASKLVKQILDFSRKSYTEKKLINLLTYLKETLKLLERTIPENIKIEFDYFPGEYWTMIDIVQFQQVITNIAVNSRDAMPDGGVFEIELSKKYFKFNEKPFPEMEAGEWIVLQFKDTGIGIPKENLSRIFEPFFTTKAPGKGTGLGLSQVYGIVKQHNGHIKVESEVGKGTTLTIYLPSYKLSDKTEIKERKEKKLINGKGEKILVVEDDESILGLMKAILKKLKYEPLTASNGKEAIDIYERHKNEICLIICDMIMPELTGIELIKNLRKINSKLKVLLITGYPLGKNEINFLKQNKIIWIQKPFKIQAFSKIVHKTLENIN